MNKYVKGLLVVLFTFLFAACIALCSYVSYLYWQASKYDISLITQSSDESMLYDTNNKEMGTLSGELHRQLVYEDIPEHLIQALLAREDEHFFDHGGVQYLSILRSVLRNLEDMRYAQGGSTITMQLTRNVYELREKTLGRKALEIAISYFVENRYDKKTILTQYLNRIFFGSNCYGLADAAAHYFSKDVKDLDLNESATLIGLVRGPSIYNPVKNMELAVSVRNETLHRMVLCGYISKEQAERVKQEPITLKINKSSERVSSYPLMAMRHELRDLNIPVADDTASIAVVSKLHLDIQRYMEESVETCLNFMEDSGDWSARWIELLEADGQEPDALIKRWQKMKRPKKMPTRMSDGLDKGLQCVVLVIDSRMNSKGDILAISSGRSAIDGKDRWSKKVTAGRTLAPFIFCSALQSELGSVPIVASNELVTARKIGYERLLQYYQNLTYLENLPDAQHAQDLFEGRFDISLMNLANLHYSLLHNGLHYRWSFLKGIYSQNRNLLYVEENHDKTELIRRESARVVASLPPYQYQESQPTYLNISLPDGKGQWCISCNESGVCVFVWVGYDEVPTQLVHDDALRALYAEFPLLLARQIHAEARSFLVADQKRAKEERAAKEKSTKS